MSYSWVFDDGSIDWDDLSALYLRAPLGVKPPAELATVYRRSMFKCFVYADGVLVGAGRALADGLDCSYIADVAVLPEHQGHGLGTEIVSRLVELSRGHKKIILYANPGTEEFYRRIGFSPMSTAMAIWRDHEEAVQRGLVREVD